MTAIYVMVALTCLMIAAGFVGVFRKFLAGRCASPLIREGAAEVFTGRYRPMERLLDPQDQEFLAAQPGVAAATIRRFRASRRRLFRQYLACLSKDYNCLCAAIKTLMAETAQDRPDLAALLLQHRLRFTLGLMRAEFHLALHAAGVGTVDVRHLIDALNGMRLELNSLRMAAVPSAA
jgi:hypothetical protein